MGRTIARWLHLAALAALGACSGSGRVEYVDGRCLIDGVAVTLARVESKQAEVTQHVLSRQPVLTAIAVAAVVLAGAGYLQRLLTVLAARRAPSQPLGERVRARMERYRAHPVRYFLLLGSVLAVLLVAGVAYVSMDADKRGSERALATLQFCHLALRSADEQHVLAEQRKNLATIQSTEGDIRSLVDKLPPAEQQKAHEIVDQLSTSLGAQRTMVAHFAQQADDAARAVAEHQAQVERGLSQIADEVVDLKSMPAAVGKLAGDVHDIRTREDTLGGEIETCHASIDLLGKGLDVMSKQLDTLADKAACPACTCPGPAVPPVPAAVAAHDPPHLATPSATPVSAPAPSKSPASKTDVRPDAGT